MPFSHALTERPPDAHVEDGATAGQEAPSTSSETFSGSMPFSQALIAALRVMRPGVRP